MDSYISKYFEANERELRPVPELEQTRTREPQEVIEDADVKQGKLNMGFRTGTHFTDDDYPALQLFNGLFGGFSHSKLFINVREKASLAYYAASRIESFKGLLMVMSGIEVGNYQKAVDIIKEQFQEMKKGDFTEEAIDQTKAVIKNQILETLDTPYGLVEFIYQQVTPKPNFPWKTGWDESTMSQKKTSSKSERKSIWIQRTFSKGRREHLDENDRI